MYYEGGTKGWPALQTVEARSASRSKMEEHVQGELTTGRRAPRSQLAGPIDSTDVLREEGGRFERCRVL